MSTEEMKLLGGPLARCCAKFSFLRNASGVGGDITLPASDAQGLVDDLHKVGDVSFLTMQQ
jgi:hypothetical protein